jgi:hypothetical protein
VQDKLRELSEQPRVDAEDISEEEAREIGQKLKDLGYLDR